jgi:hypothetical protein
MMSQMLVWTAAITTIVLLACYEVLLLLAGRRHPETSARRAHAQLREEWFLAISTQPGSEILAVQTLRNSLMSTTVTASTAVLGLMGAVSLLAPSLNERFSLATAHPLPVTPRLVLELVLLGLLISSLVASAMAVRYFHHASYISSIPVGSELRQRWLPIGVAYVRRGGLLYSWGLRHLILVAPVVTSILQPAVGPVAAAVVVIALLNFDRAQP